MPVRSSPSSIEIGSFYLAFENTSVSRLARKGNLFGLAFWKWFRAQLLRHAMEKRRPVRLWFHKPADKPVDGILI